MNGLLVVQEQGYFHIPNNTVSLKEYFEKTNQLQKSPVFPTLCIASPFLASFSGIRF
jgi:hypothetical protein